MFKTIGLTSTRSARHEPNKKWVKLAQTTAFLEDVF